MGTLGDCTRCHQQNVNVIMILADVWSTDCIWYLCSNCYDELNRFLDGAQLEKWRNENDEI